MSYAFVERHSQSQVTELCRTSRSYAEVSAPKKSVSVYRDLILSTVEHALIKTYPLTHRLLGGAEWKTLMTQFFAAHPHPFPSFWSLPQALCSFVSQARWQERLCIAYLEELVQFEWSEIVMSLMPSSEKQEYRNEGDLMQDFLYVNPDHRFQVYSYPVFQPSPLPQEMRKGEYPLFSFRHPKTGHVHFLSLSPFYRTVLESLVQGERTGKEAVQSAAATCQLSLNEQVYEAARNFFQHLLSQEAILGFQ